MSLKDKLKTVALLTGLGAASLGIGCSPKEPNPEDYENHEFTFVGIPIVLIDYDQNGIIDAINSNSDGGSEGLRYIDYFVESEKDSLRKYYNFRLRASSMTPEMEKAANDLARVKWRLSYLTDERRYELSREEIK